MILLKFLNFWGSLLVFLRYWFAFNSWSKSIDFINLHQSKINKKLWSKLKLHSFLLQYLKNQSNYSKNK